MTNQGVRRNPSSPTKRRTPSRLYVFLLGGLSFFLFGMLVWPDPIEGYLAEARLRLDSYSSARPLPTDEGLHELLLARLADDSDLHDAFRLHWSAAEELAEPQIRIVSRTGPASDPWEIKLRCQGVTSDAALDLTARSSLALAQLLVQLQQEAPSTSAIVERPSHETRKIGVAAEEAHQRFDMFLTNHFASLQQQIESNATTTTEAPDTGTARNQRHENPEWIALSDDLQRETARYRKLLEVRTERHPDARRLMFSIESMQSRLASTPRFSDRVQTPTQTEKPAESVRMASFPTEELTPRIEQFRNLHRDHEQLRTQYLAAIQHQPASAPLATVNNHVSLAKITERPRIVGRNGGTPTIMRLMGLLLGSLLFGGTLAWFAHGRESKTAIATAEQIQERLELPVVGSLSEPRKQNGTGRGSIGPAFSRWSTLGCELFLALFLFGFMLTAYWESEFTRDFVTNPFGAISERVSSVRKF